MTKRLRPRAFRRRANSTVFYAPVICALKKQRQLLGLSHTDLAHLSGVHRDTIIAYEEALWFPMLPFLVKIADALDVDIWPLFPPLAQWHPHAR